MKQAAGILIPVRLLLAVFLAFSCASVSDAAERVCRPCLKLCSARNKAKYQEVCDNCLKECAAMAPQAGATAAAETGTLPQEAAPAAAPGAPKRRSRRRDEAEDPPPKSCGRNRETGEEDFSCLDEENLARRLQFEKAVQAKVVADPVCDPIGDRFDLRRCELASEKHAGAIARIEKLVSERRASKPNPCQNPEIGDEEYCRLNCGECGPDSDGRLLPIGRFTAKAREELRRKGQVLNPAADTPEAKAEAPAPVRQEDCLSQNREVCERNCAHLPETGRPPNQLTCRSSCRRKAASFCKAEPLFQEAEEPSPPPPSPKKTGAVPAAPSSQHPRDFRYTHRRIASPDSGHSVRWTLAPYLRQVECEFSAQSGILRGDTTYRIGGQVKQLVNGEIQQYNVHFPLSELDWPLNVQVLSGRFRLAYDQAWEFRVELHKNVSSHSGKMKDSDWGVFEEVDPERLDIYSESDASLEALIWDLRLRGFFLHRKYYSSFAGLGYLGQRFEFSARDLDQWYPSLNSYYGYEYPHDRVSGEVGRYEIEYSIPYVELGEEFRFGEMFRAQGSIDYSPLVRARDTDNHLLRSMVSPGLSKGSFWRLSVGFQVQPGRWFLGLSLDYTRISTTGEYNTYVDGAYDHTIEMSSHSDQVLFGGYVGVRFGGSEPGVRYTDALE